MDKYTLFYGDCLKLLPSLKDQSVDAIITDLPYGTTEASWDAIIDLSEMWKQARRLLKEKGVFVTTAQQPFTSILICSNLEWFKYCWTWEKPRAAGFLDARKRPLSNIEDIPVFAESSYTYNPQMLKGRKHKRGTNSRAKKIQVYGAFTDKQTESDEYFPNRLLDFDVAASKNHPTEKPLELYEYLVKTYTNAGKTVLDFCMGSGTTGEACMILGRKFIGIEKEKKYFDIAEKRIHKASQSIPMFTDV